MRAALSRFAATPRKKSAISASSATWFASIAQTAIPTASVKNASRVAPRRSPRPSSRCRRAR